LNRTLSLDLLLKPNCDFNLEGEINEWEKFYKS
jgi:hypothetical protein